jgi:hypothetical protein
MDFLQESYFYTDLPFELGNGIIFYMDKEDLFITGFIFFTAALKGLVTVHYEIIKTNVSCR